MLKLHVMSSIRNLKRNKLYATINTLGVSIGLAMSFVIFSWILFAATASNILRLLSGGFAKLMILSFVISAPLTYSLMQVWLQEFAYPVEINLVYFLLSGLLVFFLTLISVGYHSIKVSNANPVEALRYE